MFLFEERAVSHRCQPHHSWLRQSWWGFYIGHRLRRWLRSRIAARPHHSLPAPPFMASPIMVGFPQWSSPSAMASESHRCQTPPFAASAPPFAASLAHGGVSTVVIALGDGFGVASLPDPTIRGFRPTIHGFARSWWGFHSGHRLRRWCAIRILCTLCLRR